jgi:hypothetical protein
MITKKKWTRKQVLALQIKRDCDTCKWWMWDCCDPAGTCSNKSTKPCTREKRQLWEPIPPLVKKTCKNCKRHFIYQDTEICNKKRICKRYPFKARLSDYWEPK